MQQAKSRRGDVAQQRPKKRFTTHDHPVRPLRVFLAHCVFSDDGPAAEEISFPDETDFYTGLVLARPSARVLGVAMRLATAEGAPITMEISYVGEFEVSADVTEAEREKLLEEVAYDTAPTLLYTYIREFFSNLSGRSRAGAFPLPLLSFPVLAKGERPPIPAADAPPKEQRRRVRTKAAV